MLAVVVVGMLIGYLKSQEKNSEQAENQVPLVSEASEIIPVEPQFLNEQGHPATATQVVHCSPGHPMTASRKLCLSYRSTNVARVREAKLGLEAMGYQVAWGLDIETMSTQDWRTQWIHMCNDADFVVNFLSVDYVQSQACMDEWNYASKKKSASSVLNVMLGGRQSREAIMGLADAKKLVKCGGLVMYFTSDGQALSVYPDDDIVQKITASLSGEVGASR